MSTDVREASQQVVVAADDQDALRTCCVCALHAGLVQVVGSTKAGPAREEVRALPREHRRIDVRRSWQHPALTMRSRRQGQSSGIVDGRGRAANLTEHTVRVAGPE